MARNSPTRRILAGLLLTSSLWTNASQAETNWLPVIEPINSKKSETLSDQKLTWEAIPPSNELTVDLVWEPLTTEQSHSDPEDLDWSELGDDSQEGPEQLLNSKQDLENPAQPKSNRGLRWPNGRLMSDEDQIHFRTAYSRGKMIQIGDTVYPNLGFNALQRHPKSWGNVSLTAIDDSGIGSTPCETGNFLDECADGYLEARLRLWNSELLSLDLHWTMHSLSGEGAPFDFSVGDTTFGNDDTGTKFGEGQSLGFVASKNLGKTFGLSLAGYRLIHLDETTDLPRNFALFGTKIFRLNDTLSPPIISLSLGLMSDVFNDNTNFGTIAYPKSLRGGHFPSIFADYFDSDNSGQRYYPNVAGVSSAFVCADQSIFAGKNSFSAASKNCIEEVYIGPIASIGFAPWPWLGIYGKYGGTDLDLGISLKPFKNIPWTFSIEAVSSVEGINPTLDESLDYMRCKDQDTSTFSNCRTRIGIFTELSF